MRHFDFTVDGRPVGHVEIIDTPHEIAMVARMLLGGVRHENRFRVVLDGDRPVRYQASDGSWHAVPPGTYPSSAYPHVLRRRLRAYRSVDEGTGGACDVELSYDGDTVVELVDGVARRRFGLEGAEVVWIDWGGAESTLRPSRVEAVAGTVFAEDSGDERE